MKIVRSTYGRLAVLLVQVIVDDLQQLGIPRQLEQDPLVQLGRRGGRRGARGVPQQHGDERTARDHDERRPQSHLGSLLIFTVQYSDAQRPL